MYAIKAVSDNHHFDHIKRHYYYSHDMLNPKRIVPIGPEKVYLTPNYLSLLYGLIIY